MKILKLFLTGLLLSTLLFINPSSVPSSGMQEISLWHPTWVDTRVYTSINAAVTAIGVSNKTLLIARAETLTASLTIPANVSVVIYKTGSIVRAGAFTLTINGPLEAGPYQIFSGFLAGGVTFGSGAVKAVYPEWWGAIPDGITDNSTALQRAIDTVEASTYHPKINLLPGKYNYATGLVVSGYCVGIEGTIGGLFDATPLLPTSCATILNYTGIGTGITVVNREFSMKNLKLTGTAVAVCGLSIGDAAWVLDNVTISGFLSGVARGLYLGHTTSGNAYNCAFHYNNDGVYMDSPAGGVGLWVTTCRFYGCSFSYNVNYGVNDRGSNATTFYSPIFQGNGVRGYSCVQDDVSWGSNVAFYSPYFEDATNADSIYILGKSDQSYVGLNIDHPTFGTVGTGWNIRIKNASRMVINNPTFGSLQMIYIDTGCSYLMQVGGQISYSYLGGTGTISYIGSTATGLEVRNNANTLIDASTIEFYVGTINAQTILPRTDDTYWVGNISSPFTSYKGIILKDTTNGKHYKITVINGVVTATALD